MRRFLSSIGFTLALLCPSIAHAQNPPASCNTTSQNLWVRDHSIPITTGISSCRERESGHLRFARGLSRCGAVPADRQQLQLHHHAASNDAFYSDSQFIGYGFGNQTTSDRHPRVAGLRDSPASEAGLSRGDRITAMNGRSVNAMVTDGTIGSAFGAADVGVVTTIDWERLTANGARRRMVKRLVTIPTVSLTRVFDVDGRKVGYLLFRTSCSRRSGRYDAFAALKEAGAPELVLDLRYNGGGLVDVARHLASLIGGVRTNGQVLPSTCTTTGSGRAQQDVALRRIRSRR